MVNGLTDKAWFKGLVATTSLAIGVGVTFTYLQSKYVPVVAEGVTVSGVDVSGVTPTVARNLISLRWNHLKSEEISVAKDDRLTGTLSIKPSELGVTANVDATLKSLPLDSFTKKVLRRVGLQKPENLSVPIKLDIPTSASDEIAEKVKDLLPELAPAAAVLEGESVVLRPEKAPLTINRDALGKNLSAALSDGKPMMLALVEAKKHVPDADLRRIKVVIGRFATDFSSGPSRTNNIKVASGLLNGHVVMPHEKFSFNKFLGQRTEAKGFKRAGIYLNGKHDFDTGGGVCQVSTTLYNTVLQAGLEVACRQPHSIPVAYVPLGQDAAVSYPGLDFAFINNRDFPVAIATKYKEGHIEFSLLGEEKAPGSVHIENKLLRTFANDKTLTEFNPGLSPGTKRIKANGSMGKEVASWRVVTVDGKTLKESLGISHYTGGAKVIEVGPAGARKEPKQGVPASLVKPVPTG